MKIDFDIFAAIIQVWYPGIELGSDPIVNILTKLEKIKN
jgi:hypothetical protein